MRPFVKVFLGEPFGRQQEFNAHAVRHMNELGNRLEQRVRHLEEALSEWSANPGGIDARVRKSLNDYDAALRQRHMTLFSALEEDVLVAHTAAERVQKLEELVVERAQAIDRRFAEKDEVFDRAVSDWRRREGALDDAVGQIGELMAMRSLLRKALETASAPPPAAASPAASDAAAAAGASAAEPDAWSELGEWMGDEDYRSFQDRFRGEPAVIAERMRAHVSRFEDAPGVVADLGCGRGEFLDLLRDAGHAAVGVEINVADVEECKRRGHEAFVGDLFEWLESRADDDLGGIFMAQVIEHLPPTDWQRFVELAARKLAPGGRVVVETINPESLYALARAYVIDPTHIRPVHPELLAFLARRAGLHPVDVELQSPVPDEERATGLPFFREPSGELGEELAALKEALVRLDRICCAPQEYTLQAAKPARPL
jgi:SAM-dependent methyltransferase